MQKSRYLQLRKQQQKQEVFDYNLLQTINTVQKKIKPPKYQFWDVVSGLIKVDVEQCIMRYNELLQKNAQQQHTLSQRLTTTADDFNTDLIEIKVENSVIVNVSQRDQYEQQLISIKTLNKIPLLKKMLIDIKKKNVELNVNCDIQCFNKVIKFIETSALDIQNDQFDQLLQISRYLQLKDLVYVLIDYLIVNHAELQFQTPLLPQELQYITQKQCLFEYIENQFLFRTMVDYYVLKWQKSDFYGCRRCGLLVLQGREQFCVGTQQFNISLNSLKPTQSNLSMKKSVTDVLTQQNKQEIARNLSKNISDLRKFNQNEFQICVHDFRVHCSLVTELGKIFQKHYNTRMTQLQLFLSLVGMSVVVKIEFSEDKIIDQNYQQFKQGVISQFLQDFSNSEGNSDQLEVDNLQNEIFKTEVTLLQDILLRQETLKYFQKINQKTYVDFNSLFKIVEIEQDLFGLNLTVNILNQMLSEQAIFDAVFIQRFLKPQVNEVIINRSNISQSKTKIEVLKRDQSQCKLLYKGNMQIKQLNFETQQDKPIVLEQLPAKRQLIYETNNQDQHNMQETEFEQEIQNQPCDILLQMLVVDRRIFQNLNVTNKSSNVIPQRPNQQSESLALHIQDLD